jgi:hypothetical protein
LQRTLKNAADMKNFLFTMLFVALALCVTSCRGGDPGVEINPAHLIGSWNHTQSYNIYKEDGVIVEEGTVIVSPDLRIVITFETGGATTVQFWVEGELDYASHGTWTLSDKTLRITEEGGTMSLPVEKLTPTTLVFAMSDQYVYDGVVYDQYSLVTFTKAN